MRLRLAFAVSTAVDADILLLDEVIGVGDASFMKKAERRMLDLQNRAKIVVLASHSDMVIRQMCNKALWMESGRIREFGGMDEIIAKYIATQSIATNT
jgi:ABC-2 type transport system ATP-binding protein/lipopolysaccharide transport system ATP-binding protein